MFVDSIFSAQALRRNTAVNLEMGPGSFFIRDIALIIFEMCKEQLHHLALVSKNWRVFADDRELRLMIRPPETFGIPEWIDYFNVILSDANGNVLYDEPKLPRKVYEIMQDKEHILTFIPSKVVTKESGTKTFELHIPSNIIQLVTHHLKKGNKPIFSTSDLWNKVSAKQENPHWVLISSNLTKGFMKTHSKQLTCARESKARISGLTDTIISIAMRYINLPDPIFFYETYEELRGDVNEIWYRACTTDEEEFLLRVNEIEEGTRIGISYKKPLLCISQIGDSHSSNYITFAPSWRSFGIYNSSDKRP